MDLVELKNKIESVGPATGQEYVNEISKQLDLLIGKDQESREIIRLAQDKGIY